MRIGELSRRTGISVRMLRYYESEGVLSPARTGPAGYRSYDATAEERVRRIRLLAEAGLTLGTIRELPPCICSATPDFVPCEALRMLLRRQVDEIDARIGGLEHSRRLLAGFLRGLPAD